MGTAIPGVQDWKSFQRFAQDHFSREWDVALEERSVKVAEEVDWKFDLVSADLRVVGEAKWLKNVPVPAAKWQAIAEYILLLQKVDAPRVFMVFGRDVEVAERSLKRVRPLIRPVEFYFLDGEGHHRL